jgi:FAD/FMN-containing dehydrogenase
MTTSAKSKITMPLAALSLRVKDAFDPKNVLNPGRLG